jgi:hypothetical protein
MGRLRSARPTAKEAGGGGGGGAARWGQAGRAWRACVRVGWGRHPRAVRGVPHTRLRQGMWGARARTLLSRRLSDFSYSVWSTVSGSGRAARSTTLTPTRASDTSSCSGARRRMPWPSIPAHRQAHRGPGAGGRLTSGPRAAASACEGGRGGLHGQPGGLPCGLVSSCLQVLDVLRCCSRTCQSHAPARVVSGRPPAGRLPPGQQPPLAEQRRQGGPAPGRGRQAGQAQAACEVGVHGHQLAATTGIKGLLGAWAAGGRLLLLVCCCVPRL